MPRYLAVLFSMFFLSGCATVYPNKNIVDKPFPEVSGQALNGTQRKLPKDLGSPHILLLGYKQDSQFDIDRWLIGIDVTQLQMPFLEVPAIQGRLPRMFSGFIDEGMRRGIPKPLWEGVVTVYADGDKLQQFTGNTNPNNARVILVDQAGVVKFFWDQGFSVGALNELKSSALKVSGANAPTIRK
jgi:hypothetical protein